MAGSATGEGLALAFGNGTAAGALGTTGTPGAEGAAEAGALALALDTVAGWPAGGIVNDTDGIAGTINATGGAEADAAADATAVGSAGACASGAPLPLSNSLHPLRVRESSTEDANMPLTIHSGPV